MLTLERTWSLIHPSIHSFIHSFIQQINKTGHQMKAISSTWLPQRHCKLTPRTPSSRLPISISSSLSTQEESRSPSFSSTSGPFASTPLLLMHTDCIPWC